MSLTKTEQPVLILGGHGRVGYEVLRYLIDHTSAPIQLASRSNPASDHLDLAEHAHRLQGIALDVHDADALQVAVGNARLVIACIGPSGVIGDRVAKACARAAVPLVDAGGYDPLLKALEQEERDTPAKVPLIISVGLMPGLTGLFPRYVMEQTAHGRGVKRLESYCIGRDAWTYNSAWDIVHSLGDFGQNRGFPIIRDGQHQTVGFFKATRKVRFEGNAKPVTTMLMPSEELARLARQANVAEARAYGSNVGPRAAWVCGLAKVLGAYRTPRGIERAARWLVRASEADMKRLPPIYQLNVNVEYVDGEQVSATLQIEDTYRATGAVVAFAAREVLAGIEMRKGVQMLHEAVDSQRFMALLEAENLVSVAWSGTLNNAQEYRV